MNDKDYLILYKALDSNQDVQNVENKHNEFNELFSPSSENLNIFYILPSTKTNEATHSEFLTWLLNPEASHGLGDIFLDKFLFESVGIEKKKFISITPEYEGRNRKKIDILIELSNSVVCIENKIDSNEGKTQLNDYIEILEDEFPLKEHIYIYLTPRGEEPSNERYKEISYNLIFEILKEILFSIDLNNINLESSKHIKDYVYLILQNIEKIKDEFHNDVYQICLQYRNLFEKLNDCNFNKEELINNNPALKDMAEQIFSKYKNILKIIKETGIKNIERKKIENILIKLLERENLCITYCNDSYVRFITEDMKKYFLVPNLRNGWKGGKWLFSFEYFLSMGEKRIEFQAVVPSTTNQLEDYRYKIEPIIKEIKGFDKHLNWENKKWPHYHKMVNLKYPVIQQDQEDYEIEAELIKLINSVKSVVDDYDEKFNKYKENLLEMKENF